MFPSILNYSAATYEAIIAAFIVVGLLQVFALRRKWNQVAKLKDNFRKALFAATGAVIETAVKSSVQVVAARKETQRAIAARDEALRIAEKATEYAERATRAGEAAVREAMEARADADDAEDELRAERPNNGNLNRAAPDLASLLGMIGGTRRPNGAELLDSILGPGYSRIKTRTKFAGYASDGTTYSRDPNAPESPFSFEDLRKAIGGDTSDLERAVGAVPGSTVLEVVGPDGQIITGAERAEVLKDFLRNAPTASPSFGDPDPYAAFADEVMTKAGLQVKDGEVKVDEAHRHFASESGRPTPGAVPPKPSFADDSEACDTQRPKLNGGGYGSPRAG